MTRYLPWALCAILAAALAVSFLRHWQTSADSSSQRSEAFQLEREALAAENELWRVTVERAEKERSGRVVSIASATTAAAPAAVSVKQGEPLRLRIDEALLRTSAGNTLVVGTASANLDDGTTVVKVPFQAKLSESKPSPLVTDNGWAFGLNAAVTPAGWFAGPSVGLPTVRLFGARLEVSGGIAAGHGGLMAMGQLLVRP